MRLKKRYFLFILILFFGSIQNTFAQQRYADSLLQWINDHPAIDSLHIITLHRLSYFYSENDIEKAFMYHDRVATLSDSLNFIYGKALAQINLGLLLYSSGDYNNSNNANFKAIEYAESINEKRLTAIALNNIGENFRSLNDYKKCREYTVQAVEKNKTLNAWRGVAINYELLHNCDLKEEKYADAYQNLMEGMPYALKSNESYILSLYYMGFGKLNAVNSHADSANYYFKKAMKIAEDGGNSRNMYRVDIAKVEYLKNLSSNQKTGLLRKAFEIAETTSYKEGMMESANLLSTIFDEEKKQDSSMHYFHIYRTAYDSIFSEKNRRSVVIKEADWKIKRKEIENNHLHDLSKIQKKELNIKNWLLAGSGVLLLLLIMIAFFIYKNIQTEKKRELSSFRQNIAETKMQALRAQMNPHFLFNSLNSIENFIMKNEKRAASDYLNKFSTLIRMILDSSREEMVPFTKDFEAIKLYVELEQLRFNHKFKFTTSISAFILNNDYGVPPLLIQPFVENAIIHGLSHSENENLELKLSVNIEGDYIIYEIEDNGIGRAQSGKYRIKRGSSHESLGIKVTMERIGILNMQNKEKASLDIVNLYDQAGKPAGTRVRLMFKAM